VSTQHGRCTALRGSQHEARTQTPCLLLRADRRCWRARRRV